MSLRLAYLVSRYPTISHTFILREVRELRRLGIDIDLASINCPDRTLAGMTSEEREEAGLTFYVKTAGLKGALTAHLAVISRRPGAWLKTLWFALRLGGMDSKRVFYCLLYFVEAVMIGHWMQKHRTTHLHVHFATPAATVAMIVTRVFPFTLSITVHGPDEFYDVHGYYLSRKIEAAGLVCAISDYARSQLIRLVPASQWPKVEITRLGVDSDIFQARGETQAHDPFEILCVGRLVATKGQQVLLDAVTRLRSAGRRVHLTYVGDGPDRAALEARATSLGLAKVVSFEGAVNQDRIREFYRAADVFVLPSFAEGIPVVLMEAMAMEIPCITTWITGIPELISSGTNGLLVPPGNDLALSEAIATLMDAPALRTSLGKAGRERVVKDYNLKLSVEHLAQVFRKYVSAAE